MSSWRDNASIEAQADLDGLLNVALGFAQQQLATRGEFYPYAAAIKVDGQAELTSARPDQDDDHPLSADVLAACFGVLADKRAAIRAGAVISDVRMDDGSDAIRVDLEHVDGHAIAVLLPYVKVSDEEIEYGSIRAQAGQRQIWA